MSYTKGPWAWDGNVWDYDPSQEAPWLLGEDEKRVLSGSIICPIEANARLIAAASELLEALKPFADFPSADIDEITDSETYRITVLGSHMKSAVAAIKKAEGV